MNLEMNILVTKIISSGNTLFFSVCKEMIMGERKREKMYSISRKIKIQKENIFHFFTNISYFMHTRIDINSIKNKY